MSDLAYLTLAQAGDLIRAKKLSPIEYTEALLRRTERLELTAACLHPPDARNCARRS